MTYRQGTGKPSTEAQPILSVINTIEGYKWSVRWFCGAKCVILEALRHLFPIWRPLTGDMRDEYGKGERLGYTTLQEKGGHSYVCLASFFSVCLQIRQSYNLHIKFGEN